MSPVHSFISSFEHCCDLLRRLNMFEAMFCCIKGFLLVQVSDANAPTTWAALVGSGGVSPGPESSHGLLGVSWGVGFRFFVPPDWRKVTGILPPGGRVRAFGSFEAPLGGSLEALLGFLEALGGVSGGIFSHATVLRRALTALFRCRPSVVCRCRRPPLPLFIRAATSVQSPT